MDFFIENQTSVISSFISDRENKVCYIAAAGSVCKKIPSAFPEAEVIDLNRDFSPFKPFLNILKELQPSPELIHRHSYSVQEQTLVSFLKNGFADERYDLPIANETLYETNRFIRTLCELIKELNHKNYIILNAQTIFDGTIRFLKQLEQTDFDGKFVLCFDSDKIKTSSQEMLNFLEEYNTHQNFLFIKENLSTSFKYGNSEYSEEPSADLENENFEYIFRNLRNNRIFMAYSQLKFLLNAVQASCIN